MEELNIFSLIVWFITIKYLRHLDIRNVSLHLYFFFNWTIIALQYYVGFYQTSTAISHRFTYVPSHLNIPPTSLPSPTLEVVTEPRFVSPESHSKFLLAIYLTYGNVCFRVTLHTSHPLLPSPNPAVSINLFFMSHLYSYPSPCSLVRPRPEREACKADANIFLWRMNGSGSVSQSTVCREHLCGGAALG